MNICMLTYSFYESDTRILQYTKALVERGDNVDVIALRREGTLRFEILDGVDVDRIQLRRVNERGRLSYLYRLLIFLILSAIVLAKKQISRRYDIIHVHSVPDFLVFAALFPKMLGARVILDIHDILPEFYASKFRSSPNSFLFRLMLLEEKLSTAFADFVIVANELWCERLKSRSVHAPKCLTIRNYPDPEMFRRRGADRANGRFLMLYPGTLNWHQGLDIAIRAFALVADRMPGCEFHIYGEGPTRDALIALTEELGLSHRIVFHGFLPTPEIAQVMASADLAIVPKRATSQFGNEAASTKIMEFMSAGVPVIVSRTKIDIFYHDESMVRFFESDNESDLATAIFQLWSAPQLRSALVVNGLRYVQEHNWDTKKHDYLELIDRLAGASSAAEERATGFHAEAN